MSPPYDVVPVLEHDAWVVTGTHAVLDACVSSGAGLGWVEPPSYAEVDRIVTVMTAGRASAESSIVAAYVDSAQVGVGWWHRYARDSHRAHADLDRLAVHPVHQGLGIGRTMATVLISDARRAGIELLTLDVRADTAHAQRMYAELGFEIYGVLRDSAVFPYGRFDKIMMVKDLRHSS